MTNKLLLYGIVYTIGSDQGLRRGHQYSRQLYIDRNGSRTQSISFNVRKFYQLSYPDRIQFCYVNSGFIPNCPSVVSCVRVPP